MTAQRDASGKIFEPTSETRPAMRLVLEGCRRGEVQLGGWLSLGHFLIADVVATSGVAWGALDAQHGVFDPHSIAACVAAFHAAGRPCLVRVPANNAVTIGWALDAGADGVIVPMVESATEARQALEAARYPPFGKRSMGPFAASARGRKLALSGDDPICLVMIETADGVAAADEIAAVEGINGIFVGPGDLAISLGDSLGLAAQEERSANAIEAIAGAAKKNAIILGVFAGFGAGLSRWQKDGFTLIAITSDLAAMRNGIVAEITAARS